MKKVVLASDDERFSVKFKGQIYDDAWEDEFGHIYFGKNRYEYVPWPRDEHVLIKGWAPAPNGNGVVTTLKKSVAKLQILR